jgi:D-aminopeptidase
MLPNDALGPVFLAAVEAVEEAIVNALVAAQTMSGINDHTVHALPHDRLQAALAKHERLLQSVRDQE